jgi:hypothetical protein
MSDLEQVLDGCLSRLIEGRATLEECLSAHPEHAAQLRPLLKNAAGIIQHGRDIHVSPAFKARGRAKLTLHMLDHPPQRHPRKPFIFWRFAVSVTVMVLALLSFGTVRAQSALPGDLFYTWKLTSERVWRGFSPDTSDVDIVLANRRVKEIVATTNDPEYQARALHDYEEILTRLQSDSTGDSDGEILSTLQSNQKSLKDAGLSVPKLDEYLIPQQDQENNVPAELPETLPEIEIPLLDP